VVNGKYLPRTRRTGRPGKTPRGYQESLALGLGQRKVSVLYEQTVSRPDLGNINTHLFSPTRRTTRPFAQSGLPVIVEQKCQSCISRCMDKQSPASVKQSSRIWCDTIRTCTQTFKRYSYQLSPIAPIETFAFIHRGAALSKKSGYKPSGTCNCYTKRG
jgi:hypothetical protein